MKPIKTPFELLTFYHFVDIPEDELESVMTDHLSFCNDIGLKGRIWESWTVSRLSPVFGEYGVL
jgi:hypothetical protein